MLHIPIFIIGGCAALAINELMNKKRLTVKNKTDNVQEPDHLQEPATNEIPVTDNQDDNSSSDNGGHSGGSTVPTETKNQP